MMNASLNNHIRLILTILLHTIISINLYGQNWFPLEIGNRWDYFVEIQNPGGIMSYDTLSVEISAIQILPNGIEYNVFSKYFPFYPHSLYKREEDNRIYFYEEEDSVDCFSYRFDLPVDSFYANCLGFMSDVSYIDTVYFLGTSDVHQCQQYETIGFSEHFGVFYYYFDSVAKFTYRLKGCIISGVTYGYLLVSVDNEKNITNTFQLKQNYPNPFNPTTTIKYSIQLDGLVTLKVFDELGREIATLIDEQQQPGKYEVKWDASNTTSGIYFYQLKAGNFVDTKKMILLR